MILESLNYCDHPIRTIFVSLLNCLQNWYYQMASTKWFRLAAPEGGFHHSWDISKSICHLEMDKSMTWILKVDTGWNNLARMLGNAKR